MCGNRTAGDLLPINRFTGFGAEFGGKLMKDIKKLAFAFLFALGLLLETALPAAADDMPEGRPEAPVLPTITASPPSSMPYLNAAAALVMEAGSGRVLYSKNATVKRSIASTTKIMTAIVALENGGLEDAVTVSRKAAGVGGSVIGLREGQQFTLNELLHGMLICSGNDAAVAIAEHIGGDVQNFAAMMNRKARELGAEDSVFVTPHGLDTPGQFSTAYDLAVITRYALKNPVFAGIVSTSSTYIPGQQLYNTNELLGVYPGADGVKTGYTGKAGRCLVTSAARDGVRLISVVLGSPTRYRRAEASRALLDYGFNNYTLYRLVNEGSRVWSLPVRKGVGGFVTVKAQNTVEIPLRQDEFEQLETHIFLPQSLEAPVYAGTEEGYIEYRVNGEVVGLTALTAWENVRRKGFFDYFGDVFGAWFRMMHEGMFADPG